MITLALAALQPGQVVLARLVAGALLLWMVLRIRHVALPSPLRQPTLWRSYGILALIGNVLPFYLIAWGQQIVASGTAGMIMAIMPLTTTVLAHFMLSDEKLTPLRLVGVLLGVSGVWILLTPEQSGHPDEWLAALAILAAALLYSLNAVLARRLPSSGPLPNALGVLVCATMMSLPLAFTQMPTLDLPPLTAQAGFAVLWLGIGGTGLATLLYFKIVDQAGSTFLANINYLIPVIAFFSGIAILNEPLTLRSLVALVLVLSGIGLSSRQRRLAEHTN